MLLFLAGTNVNTIKNLNDVMNRIKNAGLKLNRDKCEFSQNKVEFLGHIISKNGIELNPNKIEAINNLKIPTNVHELRRVLGLFNFVTKFIPKAQENLSPMNELLKKGVCWRWDKAQQQASDYMKRALSRAPALAYFETNKPIVVSADASSYALGGVLMQRHGNILKPVSYVSRSLSASEKNYAQIEKELLASVWACEKFQMYLQGHEFTLQSDHKPLIPLINTKCLTDAPIRCQRLLMRLSMYSVKAEYVPGNFMAISDSLSPDVVVGEASSKETFENEIKCYSVGAINSLPISATKLDIIIYKQQQDDVLSQVKKYTINEWPDEITSDLSSYHLSRHDFSVFDNLLLYKNRVVTPPTLRKEMLQKIHGDGHLSITKCRDRAQRSVWWPGISSELSKYIDSCAFCQTHRRQNRAEPVKMTELPELP